MHYSKCNWMFKGFSPIRVHFISFLSKASTAELKKRIFILLIKSHLKNSKKNPQRTAFFCFCYLYLNDDEWTKWERSTHFFSRDVLMEKRLTRWHEEEEFRDAEIGEAAKQRK